MLRGLFRATWNEEIPSTARLLLKGSHLDGRAPPSLPLGHSSHFTSTRADSSADGIKSASVLRPEWEDEGPGQTEVLFRRTAFDSSPGLPNPRNSSHCQGGPSLGGLPQRGRGRGHNPCAGLAVDPPTHTARPGHTQTFIKGWQFPDPTFSPRGLLPDF